MKDVENELRKKIDELLPSFIERLDAIDSDKIRMELEDLYREEIEDLRKRVIDLEDQLKRKSLVGRLRLWFRKEN